MTWTCAPSICQTPKRFLLTCVCGIARLPGHVVHGCYFKNWKAYTKLLGLPTLFCSFTLAGLHFLVPCLLDVPRPSENVITYSRLFHLFSCDEEKCNTKSRNWVLQISKHSGKDSGSSLSVSKT